MSVGMYVCMYKTTNWPTIHTALKSSKSFNSLLVPTSILNQRSKYHKTTLISAILEKHMDIKWRKGHKWITQTPQTKKGNEKIKRHRAKCKQLYTQLSNDYILIITMGQYVMAASARLSRHKHDDGTRQWPVDWSSDPPSHRFSTTIYSVYACGP